MSSDMEGKMQDRYDGWAANMAAAEADLKAYAYNLARFGGESCCLAIEESWALDGYAPEIVSTTLSGVAGGLPFDEALDAALGEGGSCPGCGACPGFTGVECDGTCAWATAMESPLQP